MQILSAIWRDSSGRETVTECGTFERRIFHGKNVARAVTNFRKQWQGITNERKGTIVGVRVEHCENVFSDPNKTELIIF